MIDPAVDHADGGRRRADRRHLLEPDDVVATASRQLEQPRADRRAARARRARGRARRVATWTGISEKVLMALVASPSSASCTASGGDGRASSTCFRRARAAQRERRILRRLQLVSAGFMAFGHGSNDAQKTMGVMTLALADRRRRSTSSWCRIEVKLAGRDGHRAGHRGRRLADHQDDGHARCSSSTDAGCAAETSAARSSSGSTLGMPVSTTHIISSAIMGTGASDRFAPSAGGWPATSAWPGHHPAGLGISAALAYLVLNPILGADGAD